MRYVRPPWVFGGVLLITLNIRVSLVDGFWLYTVYSAVLSLLPSSPVIRVLSAGTTISEGELSEKKNKIQKKQKKEDKTSQ